MTGLERHEWMTKRKTEENDGTEWRGWNSGNGRVGMNDGEETTE